MFVSARTNTLFNRNLDYAQPRKRGEGGGRGDLEGERGVSDVCLNNRRGATLRAIVPIVTLSFSSEKARVVSLISDSLRPLPRPMPMHLGREAVARGNGTVKI
ncbi:unnamed protein product [Nesidiocoris tenuis]|uniref:Uncharacterized protein n=1 Tax=Nesidiocoris tenuis TaxID=355587 RepID=A0A6H5FZ66_9HEMI|nr:unnamed protein product [Nesidiocoris tenuis]